MDAYQVLAPIYDRWQERYGIFSDAVLHAIAPWIDELPPRGAAIDLGCGTGSLLAALAVRRPDLRLWGLDASTAMLAQAQRKPGAARTCWVCAELGQPIPGGPFDLGGCFFNTLNHLPDGESLQATFAAVALALKPGGIFAFDVNNALGFAAWWQGERRYEGPGWELELRAEWHPGSARASVRMRVRHEGCEAEASFDERFFTDAQIAAALQSCGLVVERSEPWQPAAHEPAGATLWVARRTCVPAAAG